MFPCHNHNSLPLVRFLRQISLLHNVEFYFFKTNFNNIILLAMLIFSKWSHAFRLPCQSLIGISGLSHKSQVPYTFHLH